MTAPRPVARSIVGYWRDELGVWVGRLECGHDQHLRHDPPWQSRPWVLTAEGRDSHLGSTLPCVRCITEAVPPDEGSEMSDDALKYPIGRFKPEPNPTDEQVARWITEIERLPTLVRAAVEDLSNVQLDTPYRPGGWTIRQVVHHLPDSHVNAYIRFKLALTEDNPTIKPYDEGAWADLADVRATPPEISLVLLESVHRRWVAILRSMDGAALRRTYHHPETGRDVPLSEAVGMYAWHGQHHLAHITGLRGADTTG